MVNDNKMISMNISRIDRNNNNTPILYDREIDEFAHAVLEDYKPKLLKEPGAIRFEHFLESYLGVTIMFKDIYNADPERPVLGAFTFRGGALDVFDRENMRVSHMIVRPNTVVIDNAVMQPGREGQAMFTGLHEGGHLMIHAGVHKTETRGEKLPSIVYCRRGTVENFGGSRTLRTPEAWREHQADYFASALSMPNATFVPFVHELLREHGVFKKYIALGEDDDLDILGKDLLPERIAEVYGVSKRAALIKLKKSGFIADL